MMLGNQQPGSSGSDIRKESLFTKSFIFEANLSPQEAADSLRTLRRERDGASRDSSCTVIINETRKRSEHLLFNIQIKRYSRGIDYTSVRADGTIAESGQKVVVEGEVTFGSVYYVTSLLLPILIVIFIVVNLARVTVPNPGGVLLFFVIATLIIVWQWWRIYSDRSKLITDISAALQGQGVKKQ